MSKRRNGYNWGEYEQERKELKKEVDGEGVLDLESGEKESDVSLDEGTPDGSNDGKRGGYGVQESPPSYPGADIGLTTPVGRIIHDKDVRDKIGSYVDYFLKHAAKDKYPVPPGMPDAGHEFMVVDRKVLVWLLGGNRMTVVQFAFMTNDDIPCQARETMEHSNLPDVIRQMEIYIDNQRRQNMLGARAEIRH